MQLTIQQFPGGFTQSNHAQHSLCSYGRQFHLVHKGIFTVVNLPVHVREAEILHTWVCRNGFFLHIQFIVGDFWLRDGGMDISNCFFQLLGKVCALDGLDRRFLLAILSAFRGDLPQHHLRMLRKILVDGISFRRFTEIHSPALYLPHGHASAGTECQQPRSCWHCAETHCSADELRRPDRHGWQDTHGQRNPSYPSYRWTLPPLPHRPDAQGQDFSQ